MKNLYLNQFGFSLVELLVVFSIMGILFGTGYAAYSSFNREQVLVQAKQTLRNDLRVLQSKALTGEKDCLAAVDGGCGAAIAGCGNEAGEKSLDGWYITFPTNNSYRYYGSCGGAPFLSSEKTITLPTNVTFNPVPSTIIFLPMAQGVSGAGAIIMQAPGQDPQTINITSSGEIN